MRRFLPFLIAPVLALAGCGGDATLEKASLQFRLGNLDQAESLLEGEDSPPAQRLRDSIRNQRLRREAFDNDMAALCLEHKDASLKDLTQVLRRRAAQEDDPILEERLAVLLSRLADDRADYVASLSSMKEDWSHNREPKDEEVIDSEDDLLASDGERDLMLEEVKLDIRRAREGQCWAEAANIVHIVLADAPSYGADLRPLLNSIHKEADIQARDLLRRLRELERDDLQAANALLIREWWRYPDHGDAGEIHRRVEALRGVAQVGEESTPAVPEASEGGAELGPIIAEVEEEETVESDLVQAPPIVDPDLASIDCAVSASKAESKDQMTQAAALWSRAADLSQLDGERVRYSMRAKAAEARATFRAAVAAALEDDATHFLEEHITAVTEGAVEIDGATVAWIDLTPKNFERVARIAKVKGAAELGLALERLERDQVDGKHGGLAGLQSAYEGEHVDQETLWQWIATYRGESVPSGGYAWEDGAYVSALDLELEALGAELAALGDRMVKAEGDERQELFLELRDHARKTRVGRMALDEALRGCFEKAVKQLEKGSVLSQLQSVAAIRTELDERREYALDAIFDEVTYFYPYNPPAAGSGKTITDYYEAQREVDERVAAVEEMWDKSYSVALNDSFRQAVADVSWVRENHFHLRGPLLVPEEWPSWLEGIDPALDRIDVRTFAFTADEREELAQSRLVRAWNETRWEAGGDPSTLEQTQVRITNDYRLMMGRRALAWNPLIQEAADWHSNYMANTGHFGHFEPDDPANNTPFDRMRRVGYKQGVSENCHRGAGDPMGAHQGWTHSSGHHRNLLMRGHREMASSQVSGYWTQNFGTGRDFEAELDAWHN